MLRPTFYWLEKVTRLPGFKEQGNRFNFFFKKNKTKQKTFDFVLGYSWLATEQQRGNQTSQSDGKSTLNIHRKDCFWSSNTLATWFCEELTSHHWKRPFAGKDWRRKEKGVAEDEMVGWHHWLNAHKSEQTPRDSGGQRSMACYIPWSCRVGQDLATEQQQQQQPINSRWTML